MQFIRAKKRTAFSLLSYRSCDFHIVLMFCTYLVFTSCQATVCYCITLVFFVKRNFLAILRIAFNSLRLFCCRDVSQIFVLTPLQNIERDNNLDYGVCQGIPWTYFHNCCDKSRFYSGRPGEIFMGKRSLIVWRIVFVKG